MRKQARGGANPSGLSGWKTPWNAKCEFRRFRLPDVPLAPREVVTHFGLQGVTARRGLVAFLTQPSWMKEADHGLALYVMLSRATKLSDLMIIGLPDRQYFEGFLHQHNGTLVERMKKFEEMSARSTKAAEGYVRSLGWLQSEYIRSVVGDLRKAPLASSRPKRRRVLRKSSPG